MWAHVGVCYDANSAIGGNYIDLSCLVDVIIIINYIDEAIQKNGLCLAW